jgi:glycosyltransferase involved in cell wall biosynthesis
MNLLFISRAHPPIIGGIENQNEALVRHLSTLVTCNKIINKHGKKALPLFIPWAIILGLFKLKSSDQILLGDGVTAIIGWFIKLFSNKPVTCILHGLDITWRYPIYQKLWVHFFFKKIDHFIAVSRSTKEIAMAAGVPESKISIIPNGVEPSFVEPLSKTAFLQSVPINIENKFVLLSLGRLIDRKGVYWFIANVVTKLPKNMVYLIAGNGPNKEKIQLLIDELNLQKNVALLGEVNEQFKNSLFMYSDLFIQPNIPIKGDIEGFGITQLEAGMYGLPSISSNLEGIKDAIKENENGWLIEPFDFNNYVNTILEKEALLKTSSKNIKEHTQKYCLTNFEWPKITKHYIDTLNNLNPDKTHRTGFSPTTNRKNKAQKILKVLQEYIESPVQNQTILDIGTGNGEISSYIGETNTVFSVDIADTRQATNNFSFSLCNEALPFKDDSFDIIISNHVIEHVQDQNMHINEIKRTLKKNGVLYFATPNKWWPYEVHYKLLFLHYLPQPLFIKTLKFFNKYVEDVNLVSYKTIQNLLGAQNIVSYSAPIIKNPTEFLMTAPMKSDQILNKIPIYLLEKTTALHPTFIFTYRKVE